MSNKKSITIPAVSGGGDSAQIGQVVMFASNTIDYDSSGLLFAGSYAVSDYPELAAKTNNFTLAGSSPNLTAPGITYNSVYNDEIGNVFLVAYRAIKRTNDFATYEDVPMPSSSDDIYCFKRVNGKYFCIGNTDIYVSDDLQTWNQFTTPSSFRDIAHHEGLYYLVNSSWKVYTSVDLVSFTLETFPADSTYGSFNPRVVLCREDLGEMAVVGYFVYNSTYYTAYAKRGSDGTWILSALTDVYFNEPGYTSYTPMAVGSFSFGVSNRRAATINNSGEVVSVGSSSNDIIHTAGAVYTNGKLLLPVNYYTSSLKYVALNYLDKEDKNLILQSIGISGSSALTLFCSIPNTDLIAYGNTYYYYSRRFGFSIPPISITNAIVYIKAK